ncbi:MAG: hypothetical protein V2B14_02640 [bacterium]
MDKFYEIFPYIGAFLMAGLIFYFVIVVDKTQEFEKRTYEDEF